MIFIKFHLLIFFCLICAIKCVNISKLNGKQNISTNNIGPPCERAIRENRMCTLDNGKEGICSRLCIKPAMKDAKFCCHEKYPTKLHVYFCCEISDGIGQKDSVGGLRTEDFEYPYMAALGWFSKVNVPKYDYKCGGVFISIKFVLTAAHCAYIDGIEPVVILPGGVNLTYMYFNVDFTIKTVHVHPEYDDDSVYNDIALIELVGGYSITIDLWRRSYIANTSFTALGYGDTAFGGTSSDVLLKVFLDYVPSEECQRFYLDEENVPNGIKNTQVCAKDPKNIMDTCQGDSGGPLIMTVYNKNGDDKKDYLVGITSFGQGCALSPPGVYTRVSTYIDWINNFVSKPALKDEIGWNWS